MAKRPPGNPSDSRSPDPATPDYSANRFSGWTGGGNEVTGFRELDREGGCEWELPRQMHDALLGSDPRACQLVIPVDGISRAHLRIQRVLGKLRIYDEKSTNGTIVRGYRIPAGGMAEIEAGDLITMPVSREVTLLAMNDAMQANRTNILDILGTGFSRSADWLMQEAAKGSNPLLLTGDPSSCVNELAEIVHAISPRRANKIVHVKQMPTSAADGSALVKTAEHSTLVLSLPENATPLKEAFVNALFSPSYKVQLIVIAHSFRDARSAFDERYASLLQHVLVRPLAYRRQDIPAVVDRRFATASKPLRFADLTLANQQALLHGKWDSNLTELRQVVDALAAFGAGDGYRKAAKAVGKSSTALWRLLARVNLERPLFQR